MGPRHLGTRPGSGGCASCVLPVVLLGMNNATYCFVGMWERRISVGRGAVRRVAAAVVGLVVASGVLAVPGAGAAPVRGAPSVTAVAISSEPAVGDTYVLGEAIRVRVGFSEPVEVSGVPRLAIDMDPAEWGQKWASYESGTGTASLTFSHVVIEPNFSSQGVAVLADSLEPDGGSIASAAAGTTAVLAHSGLGHDPAHKVDWRRSAPSPSVTAVAISSEPAGGDTYVLGETVRVTVIFSAAVEVDTTGGTPRLAIDMDPAEWGQKWARYESGSGTATLTFAHTVVEPNFSSRGVAVLEDSLELGGGSITSVSSGVSAVLAHSGLGHDPAHKVDWQQTPDARSNQAPVVNTAAGAYAQLTGVNNAPRGVLVSKPFYEVFSDPDGDELSYSVEVTGGDAALVDELEVTLDAVVRRPGQKWPPIGTYDRVWFTAESESDWKARTPPLPYRPLVEVTLTATDPDGLSASVQGVFKIHWETYPELESAVAASQAITLTYDMAILDDPAPTPEQFTVHARDGEGTASTIEVTAVTVSGPAVTLTLASELTAGQTVTLDYAHAYRTPVRQAHGEGDPAPWFGGRTVDMSQIALAPPGAIENFAVTAEPGQQSMLATWDAVPGAVSYKLRWRRESTEFTADNAVTVTVTSHFVDLSALGRWEVRAQACNDAGCGPEAEASAEVARAASLSLERATDAQGRPRPHILSASWDTVEGAASYHLSWRRLGTQPLTTTPDASAASQSRTLRGTHSNSQAAQTQGQMTLTADQASTDISVADAGSYEVELRALNNDDQLIALAKNNINQAPGQRDTTPPRAVNGTVDGGVVTLWFSEPLKDDVTGGHWVLHFERWCEHHERWCTAGSVVWAPTSVSGNKVTVDFSGYDWVRAVERRHAYVGYWVVPGDTSLQDLAGNKVVTPHAWYDGSTSTYIGLRNITGRPYIHAPKYMDAYVSGPSGVAVSSSAGADRYYLAGDIVRVRLMFSEAVNVTGAPRVKIGLDATDGGQRWASYESGSGTRYLHFAYTVAEGDASAEGVAVLADTLELNGGTILSASATTEEHARLGHAGLGHDSAHRVITASGADPVLLGASVTGTALTLAFSEPLGAAASLSNDAFTVNKTPDGGTEQQVSLSGQPAIDGSTLTLTLAGAVTDSDTGVNVSYAKPASGTANKLIDAGGTEVASFAKRWVINTLDTTKPELLRGEIDGDTIILYFSEQLDEQSAGIGDYYRMTLQWNSTFGDPPHHGRCRHRDTDAISFSIRPREVLVSGNTVTLVGLNDDPRFRAGVGQGYNNVWYGADTRAHADQKLRDVSGNPVKHFDDSGRWLRSEILTVTNVTRLPWPKIATVNGNRLTLTFSAPMDAGSLPPASTFAVKRTPSGGTAQTVSLASAQPVAVSGNDVTLTLAAAVSGDDTVTVSYTAPTDKPLQNVICEDAPSFTDQTVTNQTP